MYLINLLGTYMADHPDRHTCGKCGNMFYKLTKDGKRMPIPKQNKPQVAAKADAAPAAKGAAKGKKKWSITQSIAGKEYI